jgi:serine/threonine-protein kinase
LRRIGRYEILQELGRGSMGAVYKARDPQMGRTVAIKLILMAHLSSETIEEYKQRFHREAKAAGQMSHPNIVTIHDMGEDEAGQPYLVMEFVEGTVLDKLTAPLPNALAIAIQLAEALDYAHQHGVIHRDLKPANIILTPEDRPKILDFGIAQLAGTQLTRAGQLLGTPAFMSPEQFTGTHVDARSDIFSLGTLIYWMCTGRNPFTADSLGQIALNVVRSTPAPARELNAALPTEIDAALARCLAKDPTERYPSAEALAEQLRRIRIKRPVASL